MTVKHVTTKYILVKVYDARDSALGTLRRALHRTATDHDIKCRDIPVVQGRRPATFNKVDTLFDRIWEEEAERCSGQRS